MQHTLLELNLKNYIGTLGDVGIFSLHPEKAMFR